MFRNQKKCSDFFKKTSLKRDNSGVFNHSSDIVEQNVLPPERKQSINENVQYLQLTNGFEITFDNRNNKESIEDLDSPMNYQCMAKAPAEDVQNSLNDSCYLNIMDRDVYNTNEDSTAHNAKMAVDEQEYTTLQAKNRTSVEMTGNDIPIVQSESSLLSATSEINENKAVLSSYFSSSKSDIGYLCLPSTSDSISTFNDEDQLPKPIMPRSRSCFSYLNEFGKTKSYLNEANLWQNSNYIGNKYLARRNTESNLSILLNEKIVDEIKHRDSVFVSDVVWNNFFGSNVSMQSKIDDNMQLLENDCVSTAQYTDFACEVKHLCANSFQSEDIISKCTDISLNKDVEMYSHHEFSSFHSIKSDQVVLSSGQCNFSTPFNQKDFLFTDYPEMSKEIPSSIIIKTSEYSGRNFASSSSTEFDTFPSLSQLSGIPIIDINHSQAIDLEKSTNVDNDNNNTINEMMTGVAEPENEEFHCNEKHEKKCLSDISILADGEDCDFSKIFTSDTSVAVENTGFVSSQLACLRENNNPKHCVSSTTSINNSMIDGLSEDGVSPGYDSVFGMHSPSKKLSSVNIDEIIHKQVESEAVVKSPNSLNQDNKQDIRYFILCGVATSEKAYIGVLRDLLCYKKILLASCQTTQPVSSSQVVEKIFSNLSELLEIHCKFVDGLQERLDSWCFNQTIGDIFMCMVNDFQKFNTYAENYQNAATLIQKSCLENQAFQNVVQRIVLSSSEKEVTSLDAALFKPIQRIQRDTFLIHDLIKHTPDNHPDVATLQEALTLTQCNIKNFCASWLYENQVTSKPTLVKCSFLVELFRGLRKLRYIFLFSNVLICTKWHHHWTGKTIFNCKWFISIHDLRIDSAFVYQDDMTFSLSDDMKLLRKKISSMKDELKAKEAGNLGRRKISSSTRATEKLRKKILDMERELILASPKLPFNVYDDESVRMMVLLMSTDFEREEWRESISSLLDKNRYCSSQSLSELSIRELLSTVKELPQLNPIGLNMIHPDYSVMYGTLDVTIHRLVGLEEPCDVYCCLELDSCGHFYMKARTRIIRKTACPEWNENFELELDGSRTLRVLCYKKVADSSGDVLLGRVAIEMNDELLRETTTQRNVVLTNHYSLSLSLHHVSVDKTMKRALSKLSVGFFGIRISGCAKYDKTGIPSIVAICIGEIEKRGLNEVGIYRLSGSSTDVQILKKLFDKGVSRRIADSIVEMDIHAVTGVLKLYFRQLPDPLFTEASYSQFLDALKLSDPDGKRVCMLSLLHSLPHVNYITAVCILEHLYLVSRHVTENKMSTSNLATIFGPTLLAPPANNTGTVSEMEAMMVASQCFQQVAVIAYILSLQQRGVNL